MITFGTKKTGKGPFISKVRRWVEEALPPEHRETMVMVNELQCFEPGCAPLETVVTLLEENNPIMFKLFKPITEVGQEEVIVELRRRLSGGALVQHVNGESAPPAAAHAAAAADVSICKPALS